jgi:hypothetical protein
MAWTLAQVKKGGWKPDARFVEAVAYEGAIQDRATLRRSLDEAVALLRRYRVRHAEKDSPIVTMGHELEADNFAFLARIDGGV